MDPKALLEALLFVSDKPLGLRMLSKLLRLSEAEVKVLLEELGKELEAGERGVQLVETPLGYEFRIKPEYREAVMEIAPLSDLSDGMMRTLALVVLKQPIKQSTIVKVQGNKVYGYVRMLVEKGLLEARKHGRTKLLTTTPQFEQYFGVSVGEMKKILEERLRR